MVWPITVAKSYVCETGKSIRALNLVLRQEIVVDLLATLLVSLPLEACNVLNIRSLVRMPAQIPAGEPSRVRK